MWKFVMCILLAGMIMITPTVTFAQEVTVVEPSDVTLKYSQLSCELCLFMPSGDSITFLPSIEVDYCLFIPYTNFGILVGGNIGSFSNEEESIEASTLGFHFSGLYFLNPRKTLSIGGGLGYYEFSINSPEGSISRSSIGVQALARLNLATSFLELKAILAGQASGISLGYGMSF